MKKIIVRYKIKPDKVSENETLIKEVYKQLHEEKIEGFHYATLKLADNVSFMHFALSDSEEANDAFCKLPAFRSFQLNIKERCDELPLVQTMTVIGSYHFEL